jgi:type IV pilus assembly protein PilO
MSGGRTNSRRWKLAVKVALGCVLAIDGALIAVNWHAASEAPQSQAQERSRLAAKLKLLEIDVQKGRQIEQHLPSLSEDCDQFYQKDLLPSSSGDTTVISDIGQMAKDAGVQASGLEFQDKEIKERGLKEVEVSGSVQGNYQNLIQLISDIERSPHFYLLEGLTLSSEKSGVVKLEVALRTYYRT